MKYHIPFSSTISKSSILAVERLLEQERWTMSRYDELALSTKELMGRAAHGAFLKISSEFPNLKRAVVFCGKGSNGGDGIALSFYLATQGIETHVLFALQKNKNNIDDIANPEYSKPSSTFLNLLQELKLKTPDYKNLFLNYVSQNLENKISDNLSFEDFTLNKSCENENDTSTNASSQTIIVDAIFGTGFRPPLNKEALELVHTLNNIANKNNIHVVSIDIASGISGNGSYLEKQFINANSIYSFHALKPGHFLSTLKSSLKNLYQIPIGILYHLPAAVEDKFQSTAKNKSTIDFFMEHPSYLHPSTSLKLFCNSEKELSQMLKKLNQKFKRKENSHKYNNGALLVAAGSSSTEGAFYLAQSSFFALGGGIVTALYSTEEEKRIRLQISPQILQKSYDDFFSSLNLQEGISPNYKTMLIGPGLTNTNLVNNVLENLVNALRQELKNEKQSKLFPNLIIDAAAAVHLMSLSPDLLFPIFSKRNVILTPHEGEFHRMWETFSHSEYYKNKTAKNSLQEHLSIFQKGQILQKSFGVNILFKGSVSTLFHCNAEDSNKACISFWPFNKENLATAGSGDVLCGILSFYLAKYLSVEDAVLSTLLQQYSLSLKKNIHAGEMIALLKEGSHVFS